ncbi:MAG: biotin carboxylase N-terminal domain-containing protein [Alphaproteobacteria bacterium]
MFRTVLIANRGEIACRIARTARRMGLRTVAVHSDADAGAMHVAACDTAVRIGPAPVRESYLSIPAILAAARASGAEAIHPGYGFLSENADFADAVAAAGLVLVGPPAAAMRAMGDKSRAKALMEKAGVPLVPGFHADGADPTRLAAEAARIGFPVLIKASAGGGGRGMRVVHDAGKFLEALAGAQREAENAFGDGRVLLERWVERARHIEVQVFADTLGEVIHLFERDCSLQRRHQKVIEEAPAPGLTPAQRAALGEAAVAAARAVSYVGAGTVEFLAEADDPSNFFFMEMNTRLQVEHPVTEFVTGLDLVEWQFRVAAGERLPLRQADVKLAGHAIEARLYAEDPQRGFLPSSGYLAHLAWPEARDGLRIDTGVRGGDTVAPFYDPMLAKVIFGGADREAAREGLAAALAATEVVGPQTNRAFLVACLRHADFAAARLDTRFIERHQADLLPPPAPAPDAALALATAWLAEDWAAAARRRAMAAGAPASPWARADGWRLNAPPQVGLTLLDGEREVAVTARPAGSGWAIALDGAAAAAVDGVSVAGASVSATLDGVRRQASAVAHDGALVVHLDGAAWRFVRKPELGGGAGREAAAGSLSAPLSGKVVRVAVAAGDAVTRGQTLMVLEAMKMEHAIAAPADGRVADIHFAAGDQVAEGAELLRLEAGAEKA